MPMMPPIQRPDRAQVMNAVLDLLRTNERIALAAVRDIPQSAEFAAKVDAVAPGLTESEAHQGRRELQAREFGEYLGTGLQLVDAWLDARRSGLDAADAFAALTDSRA